MNKNFYGDNESYSLTIAVEDFKHGVRLYQNKNIKRAYELIRKALLKFKTEKQHKLVMESTYLIANILFQLKDYTGALNHFNDLQILSQNLKNEKYEELSSFMIAFCNFKKKNFQIAYDIFENKLKFMPKFINKLQYFAFKARTCSKLKYRDLSISYFEEAIVYYRNNTNKSALQDQLAQIQYELGLEYHYKILDELINSGFSDYNNLIKWSHLFNQSLEMFTKALNYWKNRGEYKKTIATYQIMGNIYGYLKKTEKQIEFYNNALKSSENINDFNSFIKISRMLIMVFKADKKDKNTKELIILLQRTISILNHHGFKDIETIASFHLELGLILKSINQQQNALNELITALNLYQKLKIPVLDHQKTLDLIIEIYEKKKKSKKNKIQENQLTEIEKLQYYSQQKIKISTQIKEIQYPTNTTLGILSSFWIITEAGIEIFSVVKGIELNPTLFGGFISALQTFSFEVSKKKIESFILEDERFTFYSEEKKPIFILGLSNKKEPILRVQNILKKIYNRFYLEYQDKLDNFIGDISPFKKFNEILENLDLNII